uniref:Calcium uniporter protein n=1 Tax=Panagrolaimus sp. JU765 TaxID=591449 RepID=A0AC34Q713_9BILA
MLTIPLPSRNEKCQFLLRPISDNVKIFCENLSKEDKGIDYVAVHNRDGIRIAGNGIRIAGSTSIEHLLQLRFFTIRINDEYFPVEIPIILNDNEREIERKILESTERLTTLDDIKLKVGALHSLLQVDEHKLTREKLLMTKLEQVESELKPMELLKEKIAKECEKHSTQVAWGGFVFMGIQTGILFRLTYFEYSWDVVEPLSYFANYSTVLATFAYFLVTRQSFEYPAACDRVYSKQFYKRATKYDFNIPLYNDLIKLRDSLKHDLERLRDPLYQHLPATRLASLESELAKNHLTNIPKYQPTENVKMN